MGAHGSWVIGWVGSSITAVTFVAIATLIASHLHRQRQWRANPLAVGTCLIFFSCGGGHLIHSLQLLYQDLGVAATIGAAARVHYSEWHLWVADGATAIAGTTYLALRSRFKGLVTGASMFEDLRIRQTQALRLHDTVVQEMAKATTLMELGRSEEADAALGAAIAASEEVVS